MTQNLTLDYISDRLRTLTPNHERVCETEENITSRYKYRFQKLTAPDETQRLLSYMYTENINTPVELKRWYKYADLYLDKLDEMMHKLIMAEKVKIMKKKQHIENIIDKKNTYLIHESNKIVIETCTEKYALRQINRLPEEILRIIHSYMMTPQLNLIISKVDVGILQKVKNKYLKGFLTELRKRSPLLVSNIRKDAIYSVGYLRHSDIASLENINISGTKHDMLTRIEKVIACYEYCINILQHQTLCASVTLRLTNELLYIYRTCKYINKISKRNTT